MRPPTAADGSALSRASRRCTSCRAASRRRTPSGSTSGTGPRRSVAPCTSAAARATPPERWRGGYRVRDRHLPRRRTGRNRRVPGLQRRVEGAIPFAAQARDHRRVRLAPLRRPLRRPRSGEHYAARRRSSRTTTTSTTSSTARSLQFLRTGDAALVRAHGRRWPATSSTSTSTTRSATSRRTTAACSGTPTTTRRRHLHAPHLLRANAPAGQLRRRAQQRAQLHHRPAPLLLPDRRSRGGGGGARAGRLGRRPWTTARAPCSALVDDGPTGLASSTADAGLPRAGPRRGQLDQRAARRLRRRPADARYLTRPRS